MVHIAFRAGQVVGGAYRLQRLLGFGAMGSVWSAHAIDGGDAYALKFMLPEIEQDPKLIIRFLNEAAMTGALDHPSIVKVHGLVDHGAAPFLVMELLEGEPLESILRRVGSLPLGTTLKLVRELAFALDLAHAAGIVHRDIKPGNVFLHRNANGAVVPKLLDFGVAKLVDATTITLTTIGGAVGSPAYMSPEQIRTDPTLDGRSDVWSLGVVMCRCIGGQMPFQSADRESLLLAISSRPPAWPACPPVVRAILERCLAKSRDDRFESAAALGRALDEVLASESFDAPPIDVHVHEIAEARDAPSTGDEETTEAAPRRRRGHRVAIGLALAVPLAVVVAVVARSASMKQHDAVDAPGSSSSSLAPPPSSAAAADPAVMPAPSVSVPAQGVARPPSRPLKAGRPRAKDADRLRKPDF